MFSGTIRALSRFAVCTSAHEHGNTFCTCLAKLDYSLNNKHTSNQNNYCTAFNNKAPRRSAVAPCSRTLRNTNKRHADPTCSAASNSKRQSDLTVVPRTHRGA